MSAAAVAAPPEMSMEADLGATIDSAAESVLGTSEPESPAIEETQPVAAEVAPPVEQPAVAEPPAAAEQVPADAAVSYKLSPDGSAYLVPKAELPALTGLKQYAEKAQNRFPTTNDVELGYFESSDFRAMRSDYLQATPENLDAMLGYWAGKDHADPALAGQMRQSFLKLAERVPEVLKGIDPQAHSKLGDSFVNSRIEAAYARATETGDPDDLLAAQRMDWGHTGRYKTELPKHDPQAAQAAQLAQQQKDIENRQNSLLDRDWRSFNKTSLEGPKWQAFNDELDKVLAPIKASHDPDVFDALRERISKQVTAKLQEDFDWGRNHNNELNMLQSSYQQLWKAQRPADGLKPRIQTYTNDFMARVRRHLPSIAAPLLSKAAAKPAAVVQKPKPPASPQQPARAADGKYLPQQNAHYDVLEDPDFAAAFKVN